MNEHRSHHPRAWMTILLASAAALIILVLSFATLQIANIVQQSI